MRRKEEREAKGVITHQQAKDEDKALFVTSLIGLGAIGLQAVVGGAIFGGTTAAAVTTGGTTGAVVGTDVAVGATVATTTTATTTGTTIFGINVSAVTALVTSAPAAGLVIGALNAVTEIEGGLAPGGVSATIEVEAQIAKGFESAFAWGKSLFSSGKQTAPGATAVVKALPEAASDFGNEVKATVEGLEKTSAAIESEFSALSGAGETPGHVVYHLIDQAGEPVYVGKSQTYRLFKRLYEHAKELGGGFRGMQVISEEMPKHQAFALETATKLEYESRGFKLFNDAERSISEEFHAIIETPSAIDPTVTHLNPVDIRNRPK